ncbi:glycosyltransferase family 1 protein [Paraburkholderia sediminicola]|uniref:glycosyltransferase family 4 protein n=1 Tax=Paraburkholderia sediminicola TaxID=458836 RepID=UPI0038B714E9
MRLQPTIDSKRLRPRQLLVDVSIIASHDAGTGIQRVVRSLLLQLLAHPPVGFEIRPVQATRKRPYRYADAYLHSLTSSAPAHDGDKVSVANGDIFLGLDLASRIAPRRQLDLLRWRTKGVRCAFVVYDLLPALHPHWFTPRARRSFRHWLSTLAVHADTLLCISNSVSSEVQSYMKHRFGLMASDFSIRWFHLGADLPSSQALKPGTSSLSNDAYSAPDRRTVLMVGTVEPRKGHGQVLDAFELLWAAGANTMLVISGRQGWQVDSLVERLTRHPELGKRLHWLVGIADAQLAHLYSELDGLIMASEAEGFGLPLVEAAQYGMPIFARKLPVFCEVASEHATYFDAKDDGELALQLAGWISKLEDGSAPRSDAILPLTWSASAEQLKALIVDLDHSS